MPRPIIRKGQAMIRKIIRNGQVMTRQNVWKNFFIAGPGPDYLR